MTPMQLAHLDHPCAWRSADFRSPDDYAFDLGPRHLQAFERALATMRKAGIGLADMRREHFEVPEVADDLARLRFEIREGRGFVLVRGFPVDTCSEAEIGQMFFGIGTHLGEAVPQSVLGDRLGHMMDHSMEDPNARAYRNRQELDLHTDMSEIVAVLGLSKAARGGESQFASVAAIHNEILARHPEYLEPLYRGFPYHRAGEEAPGDDPVTPWNVPVFACRDGLLSARYVRGYITRGMAILKRELTELEQAALDCFDEVARREDIRLEFTIEPGQAVFFNNYLTLHARSAFEDDVTAGKRRHLLRLWLDVPDGRPAPAEMNILPRSRS